MKKEEGNKGSGSIFLPLKTQRKSFLCGIHGIWHHHRSLKQCDYSMLTVRSNSEQATKGVRRGGGGGKGRSSFFIAMRGGLEQLQSRHFRLEAFSPVVAMAHWLGRHHFGTDNELQTSIENWLPKKRQLLSMVKGL